MNIEKALVMIDEYLLSDCTDVNWRNCLNYVRWLIVHNKELVDNLAYTNETLREQIKEKQALLDATISGQETLQKYHHDSTELAYKNGYEAGVRDALDKVMEYSSCKAFKDKSNDYFDGFVDAMDWYNEIIDKVQDELIGGADDELSQVSR